MVNLLYSSKWTINWVKRMHWNFKHFTFKEQHDKQVTHRVLALMSTDRDSNKTERILQNLTQEYEHTEIALISIFNCRLTLLKLLWWQYSSLRLRILKLVSEPGWLSVWGCMFSLVLMWLSSIYFGVPKNLMTYIYTTKLTIDVNMNVCVSPETELSIVTIYGE